MAGHDAYMYFMTFFEDLFWWFNFSVSKVTFINLFCESICMCLAFALLPRGMAWAVSFNYIFLYRNNDKIIVQTLSNSHSIKPFISKQTYIHQYTKWSISIQQSTTAALRPKDKHKGRTQPICLECRSQLVQFDPVISLSTDPTHASQMSSLSLSLHMKMCTNVFICEMLQCPSCGI